MPISSGSNYSDKYSPTVFGYAFYNDSSEIDQTELKFDMWKEMLRIGILPKDGINDFGHSAFSKEKGLFAYIGHTKARMLAQLLRDLLNDPSSFDHNPRGIQTNKAIIMVNNGSDLPTPKFAPYISLMKTSEDGDVETAYAYEFKRDYCETIDGFSDKHKEFTRNTEEFQNLEIEEVITMLEEYARATTNACAFTTFKTMFNEINKMEENQAKIAGKLGIQLFTKSFDNTPSSTAQYFNKARFNSSPIIPTTSRTTTSLDELAK